jgi:hypothetical protein
MDRKEGFEMDGIGEDLFFFQTVISPVLYSVWHEAVISQLLKQLSV